MVSGLELAFGLTDLAVNRLTCTENIHSEDEQCDRMSITPPWEGSSLIPRFQEPVTMMFIMVFLVHPLTGYHTVFSHCVPSTSKNRLSYCVSSWCTQCLQEHFVIPCSLMVYPVPPRTGYHTVSFRGVPSA